MAFNRTVCAALAVLFMLMACASAERSQPKVVGNNIYSKKLEDDPILPFTLDDALDCLSAGGKRTVSEFLSGFSPKTLTWDNAGLPEGQTWMRVFGDGGTLTLLLDRTPFATSDGIAANAQTELTDRVLEREAILCGIQWKNENMPYTAPRSVGIGSTIDKVLNAYLIVEISDDGFMYDNAALYAEDENRELDGEVEGWFSVENGNVVIRLTAHCLDGGKYVLTYEFVGEKVAKITLEHQ